MSKIIEHLNREWKARGWSTDAEKEKGKAYQGLREVIEKFEEQDYGDLNDNIISIFNKVTNLEPLAPITSDPTEWESDGSGGKVNVRLPRLYMDKEGNVFDKRKIVWLDDDGNRIFNGNSEKQIELPYVPNHEVRNIMGDFLYEEK